MFTITPSTDTNNAGTFTLTISATDGINGAVNASSSITLEFIVTITDSRFTTLLATAIDLNSNFVDSNTQVSAKTVNIVGSPVQGTASPYRHGKYSVYFTGSASQNSDTSTITQSVTNHNNMNYGTAGSGGDWTVQFWWKDNGTAPHAELFQIGNNNNAGSSYGRLQLSRKSSQNNLTLYLGPEASNGTINQSSGTNPFDGNWHFLQVVMNAGTCLSLIHI